MGEQPVVTGVELVRFGEAEVGAEQVGHGAVEEPLAMQPPFAAGRDEPVGRQHLQHLIPARPLAAPGQAFGPEPVELQLAPQHAGEPAGAPLARPAEPHLATDAGGSRRRRRRRPRNDPRGTGPASASRPASSSNTSIAFRHASAWDELISPRYRT